MMPYKPRTNLHKMFYSTMPEEILQICRVTTKFQDFKKSAKTLSGRIIKQEGLVNRIGKNLLKRFNSYEECFIKFRKSNNYISNTQLLIQSCRELDVIKITLMQQSSYNYRHLN